MQRSIDDVMTQLSPPTTRDLISTIRWQEERVKEDEERQWKRRVF